MKITRCLWAQARKPFYVTTPIFYVNSAPHIGHLYSMVLADTASWWKKLYNPADGSFMTTGTDEHGMKVQLAANKAGFSDPKPFVDNAARQFLDLAERAEISYDRFIRTTDDDHYRASKALWKILEDKGFIYKGKHTGWYSVSDEAFYPELQLEKTEDGQFVSKETGKPVEWFEEENYFFALSKFQDALLKLYEENHKFVIPDDKYNALYNEIKGGLSDLSISRPASRCSWGVPVPGDESQVMYVWLEALANYLTSAGFPDMNRVSQLWPATHIVGKDIQRFHAIYWPAFLLAAELQPPRQVVVHSHWTMDGSKMSKSQGNVADPVQVLAKYGVDTVKFFLQYDGYIDHDTPYSADRIISRHNVELVNKYGNLVMRTCGPKFSIERSLSKNVKGSDELKTRVNDLAPSVNRYMENFDTARALQHIWALFADTNLYIQQKEPWKLTEDEQDSVIQDAAEVARVGSIILTPFIPQLANRILDRLSVSMQHRGIEHAQYGADKSYGNGANRKGGFAVKQITDE